MSGDTPFNKPAGSQRPKKRSGLSVAGIVGIAGVSAVAGAYVVSAWPDARPDDGTSLPTSDATEFQESGVEGFRIREDEVVPENIRVETITIREEDTAEQDRLNAQIEQLNARIAELDVEPKTIEVINEEAVNALNLRLLKAEKDLKLRDADIQALERDKLRLAAQIGDDLLAQQELEAERLREQRLKAIADARQKAADALHAEQVASPMVAFRRRSAEADEKGRDYEGDEAFVRAGLETSAATRSEVIANPSQTVVQGTLIEATLQTGLNSDRQGNVVAVVSYDVWSFNMDRVLIPRGSRVFGRFSSDIGVGQKRILVAWDRIITPDAQSVNINAYGSDRLGRAGLSGKVDNHFAERFGTAALISVIASAPDVLARKSSDENTAETLGSVGGDLSGVTGGIIAEHVARPATITVEHGDVLTIIVSEDLELL